MSKELDRLEKAFRADPASRPRENAKADALSAAMRAFEGEKISSADQGIENEARLNRQGGGNETLSKWRRVMKSINSKWSYSLAGGASVAVLALMFVGPNMDELLRTGVPDLQQSKVEPKVVAPATPGKSKDDAIGAKREVAEKTITSSREVDRLSGTVEEEQSATAEFRDNSDSKLVRRAKPVEQFLAEPLHKSLNELAASSPNPSVSADQTNGSGVRIAPVPGDVVVGQYEEQGRDKFAEIETNPVKIVHEEPISTFSVDVDTASYAFMRASLNNNVLPHKDSVRVEELINYFDYDYALPTDKSEPFRANVQIMPTPWNTGTKLLSIGIKGYELPKLETPSSNLVFLIDTSGSMNAPNKLPLLRNSFKLLLSSLKPDDTVSIVTYAGGAGTVLEPTMAADRNKILSALDNLHAGGSTAGAEGIRQAYKLAESSLKKDGVNRVILATDGDFNVGISDTRELKSYIERKRETGVTLSVLGFGQGNYNDELMQTLAQNGNGNASYIDTLSEARKVLVEEAGSTLFTIAKDVKLQVEFNPALVSEYRLIGYETRTLNREDFNNDKVDAGDIGAGHTVTALYELTPANSDERLVDDLRYGENSAQFAGDANEYGFLKIRYKLPGSDKSTLITRPLTVGDELASVGAASQDGRFAASVAAFGQLLRGGRYTADYSFDDVIALAQSGKGEDEFGYRAEFINLVRLAKSAAALEPLKR